MKDLKLLHSLFHLLKLYTIIIAYPTKYFNHLKQTKDNFGLSSLSLISQIIYFKN